MANVRITFDPPRPYTIRGKSYWIELLDGQQLQLPVKETTLHTSDASGVPVVNGVTIPDYIAVDRGLLPDSDTSERNDDGRAVAPVAGMTRKDWCLLLTTAALVIRGTDLRMVVWDAGKITAKLLAVMEREDD